MGTVASPPCPPGGRGERERRPCAAWRAAAGEREALGGEYEREWVRDRDRERDRERDSERERERDRAWAYVWWPEAREMPLALRVVPGAAALVEEEGAPAPEDRWRDHGAEVVCARDGSPWRPPGGGGGGGGSGGAWRYEPWWTGGGGGGGGWGGAGCRARDRAGGEREFIAPPMLPLPPPPPLLPLPPRGECERDRVRERDRERVRERERDHERDDACGERDAERDPLVARYASGGGGGGGGRGECEREAERA